MKKSANQFLVGSARCADRDAATIKVGSARCADRDAATINRALSKGPGASPHNDHAISQFPRPARRGEGQGEGFVPSKGGRIKIRPKDSTREN
jgi:hypothetical protein